MRRTWRSSDSVVVLAAYLERPRGHRLPPPDQQQRVANLLGVDVDLVRRRLAGFAELERGGTPRPGGATHRDHQLWLHYRDDPVRLGGDAEWIVEGRKWRPAWLYGRRA